jgi:hypothetical protein
MMLGGGSPGFLAILDGNANTCFSANMYDGVYTTGPLEFKPSDSYSPGDVGHVVFERVSDTQLRIIMRGTDSVDRSVTLTLS